MEKDWCSSCVHKNAVRVAGEDREHLTPCWDCYNNGWKNYERNDEIEEEE